MTSGRHWRRRIPVRPSARPGPVSQRGRRRLLGADRDELRADLLVVLAVGRSDPDRMYSAVSSGPPSRKNNPGYQTIMIRSQDGGRGWDAMDFGDPVTHDFPEGIIVDDEQPGRVYVGLQGGDFYASDDAGDSWRPIDLKLQGVENVKLAHA